VVDDGARMGAWGSKSGAEIRVKSEECRVKKCVIQMYRITIYKVSISIFRLPRFVYKSKGSANKGDWCASKKFQKDLIKTYNLKV